MDGFRALAYVGEGETRLVSKNADTAHDMRDGDDQACAEMFNVPPTKHHPPIAGKY
jgi:hypothetical protein